MKELGIYVHIPFCLKKCDYCDFISFVNKAEKEPEYIEALKEEIKNINIPKGYKVTTIYIGGGTPSTVDSKYIREIILHIKEKADVKDAEITIEVNPGAVSKEKLKDYLESGINRISIGLQTTSNTLLSLIGRIHTYEEFLETYKNAREIGFKNINIDLMIGLPTQTKADVKKDLSRVINLNPEHISVYSLVLENGTKIEEKISKEELFLPAEQKERTMYWLIKNTLEASGYIHYEISNFAKPNLMSKHNLNCWEQKEYIGLGVAAHSYIEKQRKSNTEDIDEYIKTKGIKKIIHEKQNEEEEKKEFMMLGLRKIQGISIADFKRKFLENPIFLFRIELDKLVRQELIEIEEDYIRLTKKGIDFANIVWEEFV